MPGLETPAAAADKIMATAGKKKEKSVPERASTRSARNSILMDRNGRDSSTASRNFSIFDAGNIAPSSVRSRVSEDADPQIWGVYLRELTSLGDSN